LKTSGGIFEVEKLSGRADQLSLLLAEPNLWDDPARASALSREAARIDDTLALYRRLEAELDILAELYRESDSEERESLEPEAQTLAAELEKLSRAALFDFPHAEAPAILTIEPGAGGTEACDWAEMLLSMYTRLAQAQGWKVTLTDIRPGAEAGIDYAELVIEGELAYGLLSVEAGVHRLVRASPYDSTGRRHTSFARVGVTPEVDDSVAVEIKPEDLRIDVFRAQGHGGQGVNTTDSAVRVVHLPTGITVTCQNTRSQQQNKLIALQVLRSRLFQIEEKKRQEELARLKGEVRPNEWGSQIRSYVLDKQYVKDHRTGLMRHDPTGVLAGDLEDFLYAGLEWKQGRRAAVATTEDD
jgi:peptide chain release factor 2